MSVPRTPRGATKGRHMDTNGRTLTIRQAAEESGLSAKAIARRVERGTIQAVLRDGVRRIPRSELVAAGLLGVDGGATTVTELGQQLKRGTTPGGTAMTELLVQLAGQAERLELQAGELGEQRAIATQSATLTAQERSRGDELQAENLELRAKLSVLEQRAGRHWWRIGLR